VRQWCALGLDALRRHQREIDDLNVYPVPDGDTGTNLVLTVSAAVEAIAMHRDVHQDAIAPELLRALARGALLGARGNSGVILSQLLRGLADGLAASPSAGGLAFAAALVAAADAAYRAVAVPAEGTVLSVARAAATAAAETRSDDLAVVVGAASAAARQALARTPEQLPALARAGVVDAGGRGLCVLLDALAEVVTGVAGTDEVYPPPKKAAAARERLRIREAGSAEYAYEVQYLLDASDTAVEKLRETLGGLGDSLVVVGTGDGTWNVHVHVNDVGGAMEAGVIAGRPYRIAVTRFDDEAGTDPDARAVVVLCEGAGLAELFAAEGAVVVTATAGGTPSTAEILAAIKETGAGNVVVLPNDPNAAAVATAAATEARGERINASVIRTRSPVQALAALAVRDPDRRFDDDVIEMAEAAGACRYGEVTVASRAALTMAGRCEPGDVIALIEGEVNLIGKDLATVCRDLLDRMLAGGGELVTLVTGAQAPAGLADTLTGHLAERWKFVEMQAHEGGQPHYPLLVGVE
jgi:DAK2 domain fusion protein YloV